MWAATMKSMDVAFPFLLITVLAFAGAAAAGVRATSPEAGTGRRVELWILAAILGVVAVVAAAAAYWLWQFSVDS